MSICPNCLRAIYVDGMRPNARQWCDCDTFASVDSTDALTVANDSTPHALF